MSGAQAATQDVKGGPVPSDIEAKKEEAAREKQAREEQAAATGDLSLLDMLG